MVNVSVDLTEAQLQFIASLLGRGIYRSRSEAVRDVLRRAEFDWKWRGAMEEASKAGVADDVEAERQAASRKLSRRFAHA